MSLSVFVAKSFYLYFHLLILQFQRVKTVYRASHLITNFELEMRPVRPHSTEARLHYSVELEFALQWNDSWPFFKLQCNKKSIQFFFDRLLQFNSDQLQILFMSLIQIKIGFSFSHKLENISWFLIFFFQVFFCHEKNFFPITWIYVFMKENKFSHINFLLWLVDVKRYFAPNINVLFS